MRTALCVVAVFLNFLFSPASAQTGLQSQAIVLKRMIELNHITPRPVDDQFSADLFDQFIANLDPDKLYFTQADVDKFNKSVNEFNKAVALYNKTNNELNKERQTLISQWNSTVDRFMDVHIPYSK